MKKKHLLILFSLLLCVSMVFASCIGGDDTNDNNETTEETKLLDRIYGDNVESSTQKPVSIAKLDVIGTYDSGVSDECFSIFEESGTTSTIRVYSHVTNTVIATLADSVTTPENGGLPIYTTHGVATISVGADMSILAVLSYTADVLSTRYSSEFGVILPANNDNTTLKVDFYDPSGTLIVTLGNEYFRDVQPGSFDNYFVELYEIYYTYNHLFALDNTAYTIDKKGNATAVKTFETTSVPSIDGYNGTYYYSYENSYVQLFDNELNRVKTIKVDFSTYIFSNINMLNNGDLLVQRFDKLPDDAEVYDIVHSEYDSASGNYKDVKYDLVTTLYSCTSDAQREIDANYVIFSFSTAEEIKYSENSMRDNVENLAIIVHPDKDKHIDSSSIFYPSDTVDYVFMANDGSIDMSLKLSEEWLTAPEAINKDFFAVQTINGETNVIDRDGKVVFTFDGTAAVNGIFAVTKKAIYNITTGEKIYDLLNNNTDVTIYGDAILLNEHNGDEADNYKILLADGTAKDLGTIYNGVYHYGREYKFIMLRHTETGKCDLYNNYGELLGTFDNNLYYITTVTGGAMLVNSVTNDAYKINYAK